MKKIVSIFLTIIIGILIASTPVSANGVFDGAGKMEALEYYNISQEANEHKYYKITIPKDGSITFRLSEYSSYNIDFYLMNENAERLYSSSSIYIKDGKTFEKVKKGTYYLDISHRSDFTIKDFYYTFSPSDKPSLEIKMNIKKGTTIQFSSIIENSNSKVSWLSTKKNIASVSNKGVVKALKKGTTTIRASLDDGTYSQVRITVTN